MRLLFFFFATNNMNTSISTKSLPVYIGKTVRWACRDWGV